MKKLLTIIAVIGIMATAAVAYDNNYRGYDNRGYRDTGGQSFQNGRCGGFNKATPMNNNRMNNSRMNNSRMNNGHMNNGHMNNINQQNRNMNNGYMNSRNI